MKPFLLLLGCLVSALAVPLSEAPAVAAMNAAHSTDECADQCKHLELNIHYNNCIDKCRFIEQDKTDEAPNVMERMDRCMRFSAWNPTGVRFCNENCKHSQQDRMYETLTSAYEKQSQDSTECVKNCVATLGPGVFGHCYNECIKGKKTGEPLDGTAGRSIDRDASALKNELLALEKTVNVQMPITILIFNPPTPSAIAPRQPLINYESVLQNVEAIVTLMGQVIDWQQGIVQVIKNNSGSCINCAKPTEAVSHALETDVKKDEVSTAPTVIPTTTPFVLTVSPSVQEKVTPDSSNEIPKAQDEDAPV